MRCFTRRSVLRIFAAAPIALPFAAGRVSGHDGVNHDPALHEIRITGFAFSPDMLEVKPGDTIRWINLDIVPHTATAEDADWDTGTLQQNEAAEITATAGMSPGYFCRFHPQMKGLLSITSLED